MWRISGINATYGLELGSTFTSKLAKRAANFVVTYSWCASFRYPRRMEKDEALIEAVRDYQCLYNSKSADFKVVLKKEN